MYLLVLTWLILVFELTKALWFDVITKEIVEKYAIKREVENIYFINILGILKIMDRLEI